METDRDHFPLRWRRYLPPGPKARAAFEALDVPRNPLARSREDKTRMVEAGLVSASSEDEATTEQLREEAAEIAAGLRLDFFESPSPERYLPRPEPSDLVKASRVLSALWRDGVMASDEIERQARRADEFRKVYEQIPWHARRAAQDPDYWNTLYASRINW